MAFLEVSNVHKAFGKVVALENVSLCVEKGEIRAILGGNGSGKSTLSKILGGILEKGEGTIRFNGKEYEAKSPLDAIEQGIVVTSQELSLLGERTLNENLSVIKIPKKYGFFRDKKQIYERSLNVLKLVGMEAYINTKVKDLTDSEKYLVELAKALLYEPQLLIVDEITSPLRREEVQLVKEILFELKKKGCTILFISHRMNEIFDICESVTVFKNGNVVNTYRTGEVDHETLLIDLIGRERINAAEAQASAQPVKMNEEEIFHIENISLAGFNESKLQLSLNKGEILGIAGLQGQGQSALLKKLFAVKNPIKIVLNGETKVLKNPMEAVKAGIGYLSGDRVNEGAFIGRTIYENTEVVNNTVLKRSTLKTDDILRKHNVKYASGVLPIESLSGGNQQKVIISRWTSVEPLILLADDPSKGIDVGARTEMHNIFRDMAAKGSAVVFVSSDDEELVTMAQRTPNFSVLVMYEGNFVKRLSGNEITVANIVAASIPKN